MQFLCLILAFFLTALCPPARSASMDPEAFESAFMEDFNESFDWKREVIREGDRVHICHDTVMDGHDCSFCVEGTSEGVTKIILTGAFEDLEMDDADFPPCLDAYNTLFHLIADLDPDFWGLEMCFNSYDISYVLEQGEPFSEPEGEWQLLTAGSGILEAVHPSGASMVIKTQDFETFRFCAILR